MTLNTPSFTCEIVAHREFEYDVVVDKIAVTDGDVGELLVALGEKSGIPFTGNCIIDLVLTRGMLE